MTRECAWCRNALPADAPAHVRYCQDRRIPGARGRSYCQVKAQDARAARRRAAAARGGALHPGQGSIG